MFLYSFPKRKGVFLHLRINPDEGGNIRERMSMKRGETNERDVEGKRKTETVNG
jgi:hypothetical protein